MSHANTKGNKVKLEWDVNHIGFNAGTTHETFKGIKTEQAARDILKKRNINALKKAVWLKQTPSGVQEVDLLAKH